MGGIADGNNVFRSRYHAGLTLGFGVVWVWAAILPTGRFEWFLENILIFAVVALMVAIYRRFPLSNLSYTMVAVFLALHTYGSHYMYANTPLGFWVSDLFGVERNHYDRIIHFLFGLLIFWPLREVAERSIRAGEKWVGLVGLMFIVSMSAFYESIEWVVAIVVSPGAALDFLGTQGDLFDAQKDHTLAIAGGILSFLAAGWMARRGRLPQPS